MEQGDTINYLLLSVVGVLVIGLIVWLAYRNQKDEEEFEEKMNDPNRDFHKKHRDESI